MMHIGELSDCLSGHVVIVATNHPDRYSRNLFYNIYPPETISGYCRALEALGATVETHTLDQTLRRLLAHPDRERLSIVNVCVAFNALESEGVIQAVAALSNIPCFPCRGDIAVISEEKIVSKHLARASGFRIVESYYALGDLEPRKRFVRKLVNSGDSKGMRVIEDIDQEPPLMEREFIEPFVWGLDVELYCMFDPARRRYVVLNANVADWGDLDATAFVHSTEMKQSSDAFAPGNEETLRWRAVRIAQEVEKSVERLGLLLHNTFVFRIDGRVRPAFNFDEELTIDDFTFLEVNALPTIPGDPGWFSSELFEIAGVSGLGLAYDEAIRAELALTLLLLVWHRHYVQSKSDDGNIPVL